MDIQDPLRIRLMSHLQMFIAQRSSQQVQVQPQIQPQIHPPPPQSHYPTSWSHCYNPPASYPGYDKAGDPMFDPFYATQVPSRPPSTASAGATTNYTMTMTATAPGAPTVPIGFTASVQANPLMHVQYHHPVSSSETSVTTSSSASPSYANLSSSKPYRPWGAEMAC